jgi:hypothetical protein
MSLIKEKNGDIYDGNIENGLYTGQGKLITFNKNLYKIYDGEFKNGKYNGIGKLTISDGTIFVGTFINDEYIDKKIDYKIDDKIDYKIDDKIDYKIDDKIDYKIDDKIDNTKIKIVHNNHNHKHNEYYLNYVI